MNDKSDSCFGCAAHHHGGDDRSPGGNWACHPPTPDDPAIREGARPVRQGRLARGQWTDAGAGLQVRLA